jgi:phosphatidylserine/phosphatidylglycerophosphate/cardiolipin synthase-like enzyme
MRRTVTALVLVSAVLLLGAAPPKPGSVPIQLGETRPVETVLGDTTLPTAQAVWLDMIRGAKQQIDLEHFYLSRKPGEALDPILDELGRAASRGVRVRLLLDRGMARTYPQPAESLSRIHGVQVGYVNYRRLAGGVQHAKFMIVDDREAWLGSQNLDWRAFSHIHELGARIRIEPVAKAIADVFETDWNATDTLQQRPPVDRRPTDWPVTFRQKSEDGNLWFGASPVKLNPASTLWDRDLILDRVNAAKKELVAQVLSYGTGGHGRTDSTLHRALLAAAGRGVKVKLIVSDWVVGGRGEADLRALAATPNVEVRISRVPEWSGGYIPFSRVEHCKFMVTDELWLWLGTSNWDPSYFMSSRNIGVTLRHRALARQVRGIFETSWRAPYAIPLTKDAVLEKRIHAETPPPGATLYGE